MTENRDRIALLCNLSYPVCVGSCPITCENFGDETNYLLAIPQDFFIGYSARKAAPLLITVH